MSLSRASPRRSGPDRPRLPPPGAANPSVVFEAPGRVVVADREVPRPGPAEVLVRTRASLVSTGTELTLLGRDETNETGEAGSGAGDRDRPGETWRSLTRYPFVPGYSNVGEVVEVGPGVSDEWLGARVHNHGKHQAWAVSPLDRLARVPEDVGDEEATFTTLAKVVMNGLRRAGVTWGECVAVVGLGLLGQLACRLLSVLGARPVLGVEPSPARLALLPRGEGMIGDCGDGGFQALHERLLAANRGRLADVVIEATGDPEVLPEELALLRPHGRFLVVSSPRGASRFDFHDLCNRPSFTIVGAHGFSHPPLATPEDPWTSARHGELFLDLLAAGALATAPLVTHRFEAARASAAYRLLARRRSEALGVVLRW